LDLQQLLAVFHEAGEEPCGIKWAMN